MNITDHLQRAADESATDGIDLHRLARVARANGSRARRRRRGAAFLGSVAAIGLVAAGANAVLGQDAAGTPTPAAAPAFQSSLDPADTAPVTGRGVTAALRFEVSAVEEGHAGAYAGQADTEAYGQLDWTDADGRGISVVGINVQPRMSVVSSCRNPGMLHCTRTRSHGATLTTYEERTLVTGGVGILRVADLVRADHTRVVIEETNGYQLAHGRWHLTRAEPPLTFAQLTRIVRRPWWGTRLPTYFLDQGKQLKPYDDLNQPWRQ